MRTKEEIEDEIFDLQCDIDYLEEKVSILEDEMDDLKRELRDFVEEE